ncbi:uncharacterized protein LOC114519141 [Dendronephthya gigantea]|uniref:uncharacterized protein LOC114519141 n=1 Tax=Dendronephthya gigantea TaxID=151771 RepID=UPI00106ABFC6|nr:uncharacterized protein LOC114519141 [Dendronephthya gigantea]
MFLSCLLIVLAVAEAMGSSPSPDTSKIQELEKQVAILTNLVHAQSNIMSKFSCQEGSHSNPVSECILKVADQAKKIAKLENELKSLQSITKIQERDIDQLNTTKLDLYTKVSSQKIQLTSLDNKYASEISNVRSSIQNVDQKTNTLTNSVNQLQTRVQQVAGQWPSGSYCILASGACPVGFSRRSGHMRAISIYAGSSDYIKQATFGDSKIQCHGRCGQYGNWIGELYINACCK